MLLASSIETVYTKPMLLFRITVCRVCKAVVALFGRDGHRVANPAFSGNPVLLFGGISIGNSMFV